MVGFGFRPRDDELVGYYLPHKIRGNTCLVEGAINEVDICSYDPWDLRLQSKYKSRDPIWYFFSRRENKNEGRNQQSRTTKSGYWKLTGESVDVKDQWGWFGNRGKIGEKRVLGFHNGRSSSSSSKGTKSVWVIHEYHCTFLPEHQRTYVICRLEYKGDDENMLIDNATEPIPTFVPNMTHSASSVVDQSIHGNSESVNTCFEYDSAIQDQWVNNGDFNMPQQQSVQDQWFSFSNNFNNPQQQQQQRAPYSEMLWDYEIRQNCEYLEDERTSMIAEENRNEHRPKNPVTGVFSDDDDDSSDSTDSMTGRNTSSSNNSVVSSNGSYPTSSTIESLQDYEAREEPKNQNLQLQRKEKVMMNTQRSECEWKLSEDLIKKTSSAKMVKKHCWIVLEEMGERNSKWDYLKNMIVGFLLFVSIIGWIVLVG